MLQEQSGESLQSYDFLINCSFASIICIKKVLQQRTSSNLISTKQIFNGDRYALLEHENFLLVIMGGNKLSTLQQAMTFKIIKAKEPDETQCMCVHSSLNKFPSGQARWCIMANPKVLTPISYEGEMRHTVPLYCYKSFFVDGWQLFIRSNLFKSPLSELTFSTLTHLQFTNLTADLLWEGARWRPMLISTEAVHCVGLGGMGEGK